VILYLLDSDHLSLLQRGNEAFREHILKAPHSQVYNSIVSVEELLRGRLAQIRRAQDSVELIKAYYWFSKTLDFLSGFKILKYDQKAETHFQELCSKKIRIGSQDLKIAAIALSNKAILLTRNQKDFEQIPGLEMEDWSIP